MGNFCEQIQRSQNQNVQSAKSNSLFSEFDINRAKIQLILGSYRYHQADLLLVFAQFQDFQYCSQIKDYAQNSSQLHQKVISRTKPIIHVDTNRSCPYKRLTTVILTCYDSQQSQEYFKQFQNMIAQILSTSSQMALQIYSTLQNGKGIPNQTLISLFIKYLHSYHYNARIYLISNEIKLLNMVRYEMAKLGSYIPIIKTENHQQDQ